MGVTFTFVFTILWRFLCMKMQSDEKKIEIENGKASACLLISNRMSFWSEHIVLTFRKFDTHATYPDGILYSALVSPG